MPQAGPLDRLFLGKYLVEQEHKEPHTCGNYQTEKEACDAFDDLFEVKLSRWFSVFKEVTGFYVVNPHGLGTPTCRIDRILIPKPPLIKEGWQFGAIGVECKHSNIKASKPLSQCIDYRGAAFRVGEAGMTIMLEQVFLWPFLPPTGAIQSLIAQRRVGGLSERFGRTVFSLFQQEVLVFDKECNLSKIQPATLRNSGRKRGSR